MTDQRPKPFDHRVAESHTRLLMGATIDIDAPVETFIFWERVPKEDRDEVAAMWEEAQEEARANPGMTWMPTSV